MKLFFIFIYAAAVTERFGKVQFQKKWGKIQQALNQKCSDSEKKLKWWEWTWTLKIVTTIIIIIIVFIILGYSPTLIFYKNKKKFC